jgi:serine/threonine-protein kinase
MAAVWCAEDLVLGRTVAVKVLAERFAHDEMAMRRFKREARAAARVSTHAHVVTIYDVGDLEVDPRDIDSTARPFIVMEYLAGGTVADAIRVGAVRRQEAVRWIREAASALDHAHSRGIVHRDIKPANFLLNRSRVLHVADFGIARLVSEDTITSTGELFGTAAYLSPEQALGREATGASDRYALAVAAFELLAGERPFDAPHFAAQARQHIEDERPEASERDRTLPAALDEVLMRGMAKEPDARFETAGDFVDALETALSGGVAVTGSRRRRTGRRWQRQRQRAFRTVACARHGLVAPPHPHLRAAPDGSHGHHELLDRRLHGPGWIHRPAAHRPPAGAGGPAGGDLRRRRACAGGAGRVVPAGHAHRQEGRARGGAAHPRRERQTQAGGVHHGIGARPVLHLHRPDAAGATHRRAAPAHRP